MELGDRGQLLMSDAMKHQSDYTSATGLNKIPRVDLLRGKEHGAWGLLSGSYAYNASSDASLFSCSLPILQQEKLNLNVSDNGHQYVDDASKDLDKLRLESVGDNVCSDVETLLIGNLLPDDEDELLAGVMDDFDLSRLPGTIEDFEEYNVFGSGGGMELEHDPLDRLTMGISKASFADGVIDNGAPHYGLPNSVGTVAGEHPYGEHPSRTLFVRNINSNVEDSELRTLFEQYGDIRTMYTACKHRGFVMISYYDIRAARTAMHALQNKPLRRRKLDIHFSIPKDNPSDKDINQGTLVVFNLDPSVSNEDLRLIFGAYGEIKEIRETPNKRHHKFIEFYDVRAAEAALKSLNRSDIAGKRIKLEPSRPGGARRNLMLQVNQELDQDESRSFRHLIGSPVTNSPSGESNWTEFNSPIEHSSLQSMSRSPIFKTLSPTTSNQSPGLASILHAQAANPLKVAPIGKDQRQISPLEHTRLNLSSAHGTAMPFSHSLPESKMSQFHGNVPSVGQSPSNSSFVETLSGPQFLWGSSKPYSEPSTSLAWPTSSVAQPFSANGKAHGFSYRGQHSPLFGSSQHHQVHHLHHHAGSAPPAAPLEKRFGFFPVSPEASFPSPMSFGGVGMGHMDRGLMMNVGGHGPLNAGRTIQREISENGSLSYGMMSPLRLSPIFPSNSPYSGLTPTSMEGFVERGRSRWVENNGNLVDSKKQFQLDLDKIISGEDTRTTLMIKNIPNKYTSKMLLAAIDEKHRGTYDFLYLPIDFKNKCNVGYAFINMLSPSLIIPFYKAFNGKKWEKFNSEKVASLAYARIQGKDALVCHFQNSSLMSEDKRCRPIVFHSDGHEANEETIQESLPSNIQFHQTDESDAGDSLGSQTKRASINQP